MVNKLFMCARVPLFAVHCHSYFDSHHHSLQFEYIFRRGLAYRMYGISQTGIPKWRPIYEPNPETGSRDYKFFDPGSWDWKFNPGTAITKDDQCQWNFQHIQTLLPQNKMESIAKNIKTDMHADAIN